MIRIRLATEDDRETIAGLQTSSWYDVYRNTLPETYLSQQLASDLSEHWRQQQIRSSDVVMLAELSNQPVGFIAVWCRPEALIDNFHVLPEYRSRGIGSNLLGVAATSLMVRGQQQASLWVFESNEAAIQFYLRCGAEIVDRQEKTFFDFPVTSLRFHWNDISKLLEVLANARNIQHG